MQLMTTLVKCEHFGSRIALVLAVIYLCNSCPTETSILTVKNNFLKFIKSLLPCNISIHRVLWRQVHVYQENEYT